MRKDAYRPAQQTIPYVQGDGDPLSLRRNVSYKAAVLRIEAEVSVDTADGTAVAHPHHLAKVLERLRLKQGNRVVHELRGADLLQYTRIAARQELVNDDGGLDPTSLGDYKMVVELIVPATFAFAARGSLDNRIIAPGHSQTFQLEPRWNSETPGGGGDAGTDALLADGGGGTAEMTWVTEPEIRVVEEYDDLGDPLPLYLPKTTVHQSRIFSSADKQLRVDIDTNLPVMAAIVQTFQRAATTQQPEDLLNEIDFFGMPEWSEIDRELLELRARRDFPSFPASATGVIPVLLARGGKWSARLTPADYGERTITCDVNAASNGDGRVRVILFHPMRPQGTTNSEVRPGVQVGAGAEAQAARPGG